MEDWQGKSKSLTILQKLEIIGMVEGGRSVKEVAEETGLNRNTLHYILKNRDKISEASKKPGLSCHKRIKQTKNPELEKIILNYIYKAKANGEKLTGSIIKAVALETSLNMNCTSFAASNGWLFSFLKRNDIAMSDLNRSGDLSTAQSSTEHHSLKEDDNSTVIYEEIQSIEESSKTSEEEEGQQEGEEEEVDEIIEELEVTVENTDLQSTSQEAATVPTQINWRDWCRLCGHTEAVVRPETQLLDIAKFLLSIESTNEEMRVCHKCSSSLSEISKMIYKGKLVENMFNELQEHERANCLTDEGLLTIRQEYGFDQPQNIQAETVECKEQHQQQRLDDGNESANDFNDVIYEVDYLEEAIEDMDFSQDNQQDVEVEENVKDLDQQAEYEIYEEAVQEDGDDREKEEVEALQDMIDTEEYSSVVASNKSSSKFILPEEDVYNYTCHVCFEVFERMCFLTNHTRQQHDCLPKVACPCGKSLSTWESLMNHKRKHSTEPREWICGLCDARFMSKTALSIHIKFKHEKQRKNPRCKVCDKEFSDSQMLRNHERIHLTQTERMPVECHICLKSLSSKYSLRHHIATVHEQQRNITCHICSKGFANRSNLKSHLISHTTENVVCEICNSVFKNRISLQSHKKIHKPRELLNFACGLCHRRFHNRTHLERHMIAHSDVRSFKCSVENCGVSYKWEKDLKNHIQAVHNGGKENNKCNWCDRTFVDIANLRKHKLKHHPHELAEFEAKYGRGRRQKSLLQ